MAPSLHLSSIKQYAPKTNEELATVSVPISSAHSVSKKQINATNLSSSELESLRKNDPFMYYSIPSVMDAEFVHKKFPPRRNDTLCAAKIQARHKTTPSLQMQMETVTRRTCISFECHSDLIMEDILNGLEEDEENEVGMSFEDLIISYVARCD